MTSQFNISQTYLQNQNYHLRIAIHIVCNPYTWFDGEIVDGLEVTQEDMINLV
jgi:hypothetical protein